MFSKYDVYTTVQSMYYYPDSDVLKNKLNIRDKAELKQAEEDRKNGIQVTIAVMKKNKKFQKEQLKEEGYGEIVEFFNN